MLKLSVMIVKLQRYHFAQPVHFLYETVLLNIFHDDEEIMNFCDFKNVNHSNIFLWKDIHTVSVTWYVHPICLFPYVFARIIEAMLICYSKKIVKRITLIFDIVYCSSHIVLQSFGLKSVLHLIAYMYQLHHPLFIFSLILVQVYIHSIKLMAALKCLKGVGMKKKIIKMRERKCLHSKIKCCIITLFMLWP